MVGMIKPTELSRDVNERANEIGRLLTGEPSKKRKNPSAVLLGRLGGLKGGKARADKLTMQERRESAKIAAKARWGKKS
jgi:hypothetical protein